MLRTSRAVAPEVPAMTTSKSALPDVLQIAKPFEIGCVGKLMSSLRPNPRSHFPATSLSNTRSIFCCICTLETEQEISSKSLSEWNTARKPTNRRGSAPTTAMRISGVFLTAAFLALRLREHSCVCGEVEITGVASATVEPADCELKTLLPNLFADWFAFNCVNILSKRR
jgi:hypothetical protein